MNQRGKETMARKERRKVKVFRMKNVCASYPRTCRPRTGHWTIACRWTQTSKRGWWHRNAERVLRSHSKIPPCLCLIQISSTSLLNSLHPSHFVGRLCLMCQTGSSSDCTNNLTICENLLWSPLPTTNLQQPNIVYRNIYVVSLWNKCFTDIWSWPRIPEAV